MLAKLIKHCLDLNEFKEKLAAELKADNPKFNRTMFFEACNKEVHDE